MRFKNRSDAGRKLAEKLAAYGGEDAVVYALPRGGVVLGYEIARKLAAPLDLIIPRKIGHPSNPEYAIGVVVEDGHTLFGEQERLGVDAEWMSREIEKERQEAHRRRSAYLKRREPISTKGKTAIVVDDGAATGLSLLLAIREIKEHQKPRRLIAALPVAPADTAGKIKKEVDELVALYVPSLFFGAVGAYYKEFGQVEDAEVVALMEKASQRG